jgi:hypothetical protein
MIFAIVATALLPNRPLGTKSGIEQQGADGIDDEPAGDRPPGGSHADGNARG